MKNHDFHKLLVNLQDCGLSYAEFVALQLPYYQTRHHEDAADWACRFCAGPRMPVPSTSECERAFDSLIQRGYVQIIDASVISTIHRHLDRFPARGPVNGLPVIDQIDLTLAGYDLWKRLWIKEQGEIKAMSMLYSAVCPVYRNHNQVTVYTFQEWDAWKYARTSGKTVLGRIEHIGKWRADWWQLIPSGVRLRCVDSSEAQDQLP